MLKNYFNAVKFSCITAFISISSFIFPNPSSESFEIGSANLTWQIVKIFDINGTLLGQHYADEVKINVSSLSSGLYLIQIKSDKVVETHQFLKL